jgi:hypothetical protein
VRVRLRLLPRSSNRFIGSLVALISASVSLLALSGGACAQRYVTFDPPGSTYTFVSLINDSGWVVGAYDDSVSNHSYLRNVDGSFVEFDPPGALGSTAVSINSSGEIAGYWYALSGAYEGYYRDSAGNITTFVVQTSFQDRTFAYSINDRGSIVGAYVDTTYHGFLRDASGTITVFDPPGSTLTIPETINQSGFISGAYYDSASLIHGFILSPAGNYTILNVPGASGQGTAGAIINDRGQVAGVYTDGISEYGYVRSAGGAYTTFHISGAADTEAGAINDLGEIAGVENKASGLNAGFVRSSSGNITVFQVPGAGVAQEEDQGTVAVSINSSGTVAGYYYDTSKVPHGFIRY